MGSIAENLKSINDRIAEACFEFGRNPNEVTLVGISKTKAPEEVEQAIQAGLLHLGENKVQEAEDKIPRISGNPVWHMVGHLQTNKVKKAIKLFDIIESVDSLKLAETISKECVKSDISMVVLLEVNSSGEASKFGLEPDEIMATAEKVNELDNLELRGLMTIGPFTNDAGTIDKAFEETQVLYQRMQEKLDSKITILSMGMTADFERAIKYGSTELRIGTAIFGPRNYN